MKNMESQFMPPLLNPRTNILSSIYPKLNFPAEPVMKINNLSRPKVPAPLQNQMVVPLLQILEHAFSLYDEFSQYTYNYMFHNNMCKVVVFK